MIEAMVTPTMPANVSAMSPTTTPYTNHSAASAQAINHVAAETPIHLPAADVLTALPGDWSGRTARAGTGFWLTAERS